MTDQTGRDGSPPAQQSWPQGPPPAPPGGAAGYGQPGWDQPAPGPQAWAPAPAQPGWDQAYGQAQNDGTWQGGPAQAGAVYPGAAPVGAAQGYGPPAGYDGQVAPPGYGPPPGGWPTPAYGPGGPGGPAGPAAPGAGPPRGPRKRWPIVTALVAIVVIAAGVVIGLKVFGGGSNTPGEAVNLLAADLAKDDYLSAVSRLHPAEASLAADMSQVVTSELKRLDVLRPDADATASLGTLTFTDLRFDDAAQEKVRDNVVINKLVAGTITVDANGADLPFTDSFKAKAFPGGVPAADVPSTIDIAKEVAEQGEPIRIASVEVDGNWYVSLYYTIADYALREANVPWPTTTVAARGAASGEEALTQTVQAILDQDARRLVELAPPQELAVVHDAGQAIIDGAGTGTPTGARLVELDTTEQDVRGQRALTLNRVVVADPSGSRFTLTRSGDCVTVEADGASQQLCTSQLAQTFGSELAGVPPALQRLVPKLAEAALDVKVIVVEEGGSWYVSPSRTLVQLYADLLGAFEPQDISDLVAAAPR